MRKRILSAALALFMLLTLLPALSVPAGAVLIKEYTDISVDNISGETGAAVTLTATLTSSGSPVSGQSITFSIDSTVVGSAGTGADGVASLSYTIALSEGNYTIEASFSGSVSYYDSSGSGSLTVAADTTPPASPVYSPLDNATGVAVNATPMLAFSEALYSDASGTPVSTMPTGIIKVYKGSDNSGTPLTEGAGADNDHFTVAYDSVNHLFTVTFGAELINSQTYCVELQSNSVYDASGNPISTAQSVTFTTAEASYFAGGMGTSGDPYEIATSTQLIILADLVNSGAEDPGNTKYSTMYYELTSDITLDGEWTPIGTYQNTFSGHFNGNGHTISGLTITSGHAVGLFAYTESGSEIKNIGLKDVSITADMFYAGGVVGYCYGGSISGCWVSGSVSCARDIAGGVVGFLDIGGSIENCYSMANVKGTTNIGGVAGIAQGPVSFCYATGNVTATGEDSYAGGIAGSASTVVISNCAALNLSVSGGGDNNAGRIVGCSYLTTTLSGNVALADMTGGDFGADRGTGTKNGADKTATEIASAGFWNMDTVHFQDDWSSSIWDIAAGKLPRLKNFSSSQPELPFPFGGVDGSSLENAYLISSEYQLRLLAFLVNAGYTDYNNEYYRLTADIALNDETLTLDSASGILIVSDGVNTGYVGTGLYGKLYNRSSPSVPGTWYTQDALTGTLTAADGYGGSLSTWTPVGVNFHAFLGYFDGGGHTVSGIYINDITASGRGLFGLISGSVVENVGVVNSYISGSYSVAGIAGYAKESTIQNCYNAANIGASGNGAGGIVGITGYQNGYDDGYITNCYNIGSISGIGDFPDNLGGIVGSATHHIITYCYNAGSISGYESIGGIAGHCYEGSVLQYCYSSGGIENYPAGSASGSVVGNVLNEWDNITDCNISYCYYDKQISDYYGIGSEMADTVGDTGSDITTEGKLTSEMTGNNLSSLLGTASSWTFSENLYPRLTGSLSGSTPCDMDETYAAYVSASPVFLRDNSAESADDYETFASVCTDFTLDIQNGVSWTSSNTNVVSISSGSAEIVRSSSDGVILSASAYSISKSVMLISLTNYSSVTYDPNGGSGSAPVEADKAEGAAFTAAVNSFTAPSGKEFDHWNTSADGTGTSYASGATITMPAVDLILYAIWKDSSQDLGGGGGGSPLTIIVTETSSALFKGARGEIMVAADMTNAFSTSVEVKVTNTNERAAGFGLGIGNTVYPFDISLYIKGTNIKTNPKDGYAVTISLPIPDDLLDVKDHLSIAHKSGNGIVTVIASQLKQIKGVWYLVLEATEFSPFALVVSNVGTYDEAAGLPYYVDSSGNEVFIGLASNGKYIAPSGVTVLFKKNTKSFRDTGSHWAKDYIGFTTEREIFLGTGSDTFSPDSGMTRAMLATVIGRLYERSYGKIEDVSTHAFTDCDYGDYYGEYVDWAAENSILDGYGNGDFGPDDPVTREQMATILYRFADFLGVLPDDMDTVLSYPDAAAISSYAVSAALYCQSTGIITGRDGGSFVPQGTATRAEVAVILKRFIKNIMG